MKAKRMVNKFLMIVIWGRRKYFSILSPYNKLLPDFTQILNNRIVTHHFVSRDPKPGSSISRTLCSGIVSARRRGRQLRKDLLTHFPVRIARSHPIIAGLRVLGPQ